ncbi:MAG: GtrA family protein [Thermonemataceae bacterium]
MKVSYLALYKKLRDFLLPKLKFATTSSVATAVDYVLYLVLVTSGLRPVVSNLISGFCGMVLNFILQKRFVFLLKRDVKTAFVLSICFSLLGILIGTSLIYLLNKWIFFQEHQYITKLIVTGIVFFYNFYTKRFAFEKGKKNSTSAMDAADV